MTYRPELCAVPGAQANALARQRQRPMLHGLVLGLIAFGVFYSLFVSKTFLFQLQNSAPITGLSLPSIGARPREEPVLTSAVLPDTVRREEMADALQAYAGQAPIEAEASLEAVQAPPAPALPYQLYAVQEGDTASAVATRFGIDLEYLLWNNVELRDGDFLEVGQMLSIPAGNGILHYLRYGETLSSVADRYGVTLEQILSWPGNELASPDRVIEDQLVFVPEGAPPVSVLPEPAEEPALVEAPPAPPPAEPPPAEAPPAPAVSGTGLIWPVTGPISSYMDASHPLGIDIDLFNSPGAAVAASTSGTVTFAGGNPCCSYGLYVVIVSADGIETLYAHLSSIAVSPGQQVSQGETIANAGCTGYCTGNHLHLEVIDNGVRVNPLGYLP